MFLTKRCPPTFDGSSEGDDVPVVLVLNGDDDVQHVDGLAVERFAKPDPSGLSVDRKIVAGNCVEQLGALGVDALQGVDDRIDRSIFRDFKIELKQIKHPNMLLKYSTF